MQDTPLGEMEHTDSHSDPSATPLASEMAPTSSLLRASDLKRRRVTRACDNCRLKKVKCDGKQPCIHCTVYLFSCTYDRPNVRNKKVSAPMPSTPQSTALLQLIAMNRMPSITTINSNLILSQNILALLFPKLKFNFLDDKPQNFDFVKFEKVVGYLQHKNPGNYSVNDIMELYHDGPTPTHSPTPQTEPYAAAASSADESIGAEIKIILPPKQEALQLIYTTWNKACVLFRFYHRPSLLEEVDLLYNMDPLHYTDRQQKFLPFLYSVLACGSLFSKSSYTKSENNDTLEEDGFRYFLEARKLVDITNVGDIPSIQTIVMMIVYLQCSARLSTCYSYIGIALRSALKEGLHRNLSIFQSRRKLDPIEADTRKRLFYTIYKMDIYINSLLGLPRSISEDEFDQELPVELDDQFITRDAYLYEEQGGRLSSSGCANHHTKLTIILSKIVKELYPIKVKPKSKTHSPNIHDKVTELELELKHWLDNLPQELRPTNPSNPDGDSQIPERFKLANYYLHLSFLNCQISLYRPFIHYISNGYQSQSSDPRSLIRGRNCIKVARMVVKLANKMIDQKLLIGTYWFSMYTIFFSIACLIYYFHFANYINQKNNVKGVNYAGVMFDDDLNIEMIRKDIEIGRKVLNTLKNMSNASLRIYNILNSLFEQLNRRTADTSMKASVSNQTSEAVDDGVQDILSNFDMINDFTNKEKGDTFKLVDSQLQVNSEGRDQLFNFLAKPKIDENIAAGIKIDQGSFNETSGDGLRSQEPFTNEVDNFIGNSAEKKEGQQATVSPTNVFDSLLQYVPGVIDTLDKQIFGRMLPPYMLEGQKRQDDAEISSGLPQSNSNYLSGLEDFDFDSTAFDPTQFDALEPFGPV